VERTSTGPYNHNRIESRVGSDDTVILYGGRTNREKGVKGGDSVISDCRGGDAGDVRQNESSRNPGSRCTRNLVLLELELRGAR
jgi:hypothetical protein